ncbi:MAG: acyl-CoA dehydrogenase family protein [Ktedonobacteraceae bacterium]|nr:acyl-CoA dehydrogenase family protein [Ktedonobacteraceae bacterium]
MTTTQQEAHETTAGMLVQRARELAPRLRERAAQTEALRSLPPETVEDLRASGLLRVQKPARYGGYQLGYDVLTAIFIELAQGCASTSWVSMILNSAGIVAGFPDQAQEELWGSGADNLVCGVFSAVPVQLVDGGYRLSGSWLFASGIDHADWLFLGGLVPGERGATDMRFFLLPKSEISIVDDWFVLGLRGTGSKKVVANDVFVPGHRSVSMALLREGNSPGAEFHDSPLYRIPLAAIYHTSAVGPAIGAAKGALRDYIEWTRTRTERNTRPLIENAETQIHLAESSADIDVAERIIRADIAEVMALAGQGRSIDPLERARYHRDAVYCSALCVRAVDRLFEQSGGSVLHDEHPVQRAWRDIHAAAAHHSNRWDSGMQHYGRMVFGLGSANPFFY